MLKIKATQKRDQERMRVHYQSAVLRVAKLAENG